METNYKHRYTVEAEDVIDMHGDVHRSRILATDDIALAEAEAERASQTQMVYLTDHAREPRTRSPKTRAYREGYYGLRHTLHSLPMVDHFTAGLIDRLADAALDRNEERLQAAEDRAEESWNRPGGPAELLRSLGVEA